MDNTPSDAPTPTDSSAVAGLPGDVASLSYEQARDELVSVVSELEQGASTLERSLALWERGEALARRCEEWLMGARERLEAARRQAPTS
ncbi:exodeoxyribonuclease 7 small subunit [Frigoribacterium faeni]|uniref:Exodeoxyribonuclease 7 small subunit n=1 Tax=Frigoribacterium faeni TaxID=145483 RepID=A0A7W3PJ28_9MICO|nr:exodeoxyribonuclease VII small subunit [Frigoribacterium faeni]BFF14797.1 exodeoxyribonuclease VII small subunit [Microbacterium flavescens]GEK82746.1 exodeoxyribonuclease 7 small subunit [Frigoribacterium faeni]